MPLYEYLCSKCKENFSLIQSIGATEKNTICPHCGSSNVKKLISSFACSVSYGSPSPSSGFSGGS